MAQSGSIRVVSKRKGGIAAAAHETLIDADRNNPLLGNRHILRNHRDAKERAQVIAAHGHDLAIDLANHGPIDRLLDQLAERVRSGEHIALACWCSPRPCHADRYAAIIAERAGLPIPQAIEPGLFAAQQDI
ncbi:MAG: DUF4326 domain-containing protein [Sphingobium sp.]